MVSVKLDKPNAKTTALTAESASLHRITDRMLFRHTASRDNYDLA